jgi:hypothetical protein
MITSEAQPLDMSRVHGGHVAVLRAAQAAAAGEHRRREERGEQNEEERSACARPAGADARRGEVPRHRAEGSTAVAYTESLLHGHARPREAVAIDRRIGDSSRDIEGQRAP